MANVSGKKIVEETKTHVLYYTYIYIFFFENRAFYVITWENMLQPDRPQITI